MASGAFFLLSENSALAPVPPKSDVKWKTPHTLGQRGVGPATFLQVAPSFPRGLAGSASFPEALATASSIAGCGGGVCAVARPAMILMHPW